MVYYQCSISLICTPGPRLNKKRVFPDMGISIIKIRPSYQQSYGFIAGVFLHFPPGLMFPGTVCAPKRAAQLSLTLVSTEVHRSHAANWHHGQWNLPPSMMGYTWNISYLNLIHFVSLLCYCRMWLYFGVRICFTWFVYVKIGSLCMGTLHLVLDSLWTGTWFNIKMPSYQCRGSIVETEWWRHEMETFSALLALCAGNSRATGEFPSQRPVTRSFDVFFDLPVNKRLSNQSWCWWFETPSRSFWRHCNETTSF